MIECLELLNGIDETREKINLLKAEKRASEALLKKELIEEGHLRFLKIDFAALRREVFRDRVSPRKG